MISEEDKVELEEPLSLEELNTSIRSMQCSKTPGPDGFSSEFYKTFSALISPLILNVFNESFNAKTLPSTFNQACIFLFLKQDKDPLDPGSYRPTYFGSRLKVISLNTGHTSTKNPSHNYLTGSNRFLPRIDFYFQTFINFSI